MRIVMSAIIQDGDKFLISKQGKSQHHEGLWAFPGGKLRMNESIYEGLKREMQEELGVEVKPLKIIHSVIYEKDNIIILFVLCEKILDNISPCSDIDEYKWARLNEITNMPTRPLMKTIIKEISSKIS